AAPPELFTLSLHDALPIFGRLAALLLGLGLLRRLRLVGGLRLVRRLRLLGGLRLLRRPLPAEQEQEEKEQEQEDDHGRDRNRVRSEEHTSELQSPCNLVCR